MQSYIESRFATFHMLILAYKVKLMSHLVKCVTKVHTTFVIPQNTYYMLYFVISLGMHIVCDFRFDMYHDTFFLFSIRINDTNLRGNSS